MGSRHITELIICTVLFLIVAVMGFMASRWKRGDTMHSLDQWGLGGRQFGTWVTWFLVGGDLYTAYTFVAVPALMFGAGAMGFFAVPYATIAYPMVFLVLIRLWSVSHVNGFVTTADFVKARFDSKTLALLIAITGIVATMPYIALQLVGVQAILSTMGIKGSLPLIIAFVVLALYTYNSGLRAPALIAFVKDILIYIVIIVAIVYIPTQIKGGWAGIFSASADKFSAGGAPGVLLAGPQHLQYISLAFGSALALMLYPHAATAILAAKNRKTIKRNMALLPAYSLMLGFLSLLGFMAIASGAQPIGADPAKGIAGDGNTIVPVLFDMHFNSWFAGIAFAAIAVGALVPAAVMSIAASNTFTRNIYKAYFKPDCTPKEETLVAKIVSLVVKFGAVGFIIFLNPSYAIDLQLVGGVIILTTLPAVGLGLLTNWFHRAALITGWVVSMAMSIYMLWDIPKLNPKTGAVVKAHFGGSGWPLAKWGFDTTATIYVGIVTLAVGIVVAVLMTWILRAMKVPAGRDSTKPWDYYVRNDDEAVKVAKGDTVPASTS